MPAVGANGKGGVISVNYDDFIRDVSTGDELLVDGGIMSFVVTGKSETDVEVRDLHGASVLYLVTSLPRCYGMEMTAMSSACPSLHNQSQTIGMLSQLASGPSHVL